MKNIGLFSVIRTIAMILGFFGALSFMRTSSTAFNYYAQIIYGDWFNFGIGLSVLWFAVCAAIFAYAVWQTKNFVPYNPLRRADFTIFVLFCAVGIVAGVYTLIEHTTQFVIILIPITTYFLAMMVFGEFLARLRDKVLLKTLYWLVFFKHYPLWRFMGFIVFIFLVSQLYLLVVYFFTPIRIFALFTIAALTYFAAYMLNMAKEYEAANAEKIRAERFKAELITNVSHDIKTPLTSIINYVDLLKDEENAGKSAEYIAVIDKKSARLKVLIDDLMEASKAGTRNLRVDMQEINLVEIVGQVAGEFEYIFIEKGLTLVLRQPNEATFIKADSRHLHRVLENLFSNASKYALFGTRVFAEITLNDGKANFVIQNTSSELIDFAGSDVTEQFLRGDKSRQTEGSGLGLYIAKSLMELMGGEMQIHISGDLFKVVLIMLA
ncbi:MAG: HAMP domain-containing histidine kinase [Defluviitaleaceae bacterium]|nr:HAMP domain-containing histidine kinase [Defluviitaleaceae bacterium]